MIQIQPVLDACKTITALDTPTTANRKVMAIASLYCKHHQHSDELVLIVSIKGLKPMLYSHSYNFSITNLHEKVKSALNKARKALDAEILVLEWIPSKQVKIPYYVKLVA